MQPILISIDGLRGAGKTTQITALRKSIKTSVEVVADLPDFSSQKDAAETLMRLYSDKPACVNTLNRFTRIMSVNQRLAKTKSAKVYLMDWVLDFFLFQFDDRKDYATWQLSHSTLMTIFPTVAFYIDTPHSERMKRVSTPSPQLMLRFDVPSRIASMPDLYYLDGRKSIDAINREIRSVLQSKGLDWIFNESEL